MIGSKIAFLKEKINQLSSHYGFRRYFANTGWLFLGRMFGLLVSFFVGAYVARYLGPQKFGTLSYVASFVGLFSFISSLGSDSVLNKELIKNPQNRDRLLGSTFLIKIIGGLFTVFIITIISFYIHNDKMLRIFVFIFSLNYIFQSLNVIDLYFQSQVVSKNTVKAQVVSTFLNAIFKIIIIYLRLDLIWFVFSYVLDTILLSVGLVFAYKKLNLRLRSWQISKSMQISILKESWPLMLAGVSMALYSRIDQVFIKHMMDDASVGLYSVGVRLSEVWYFVPSLIASSVFPAIVNAKLVSEELYKKRFVRLYFILFWSATFLALVVSLFSANLIRIVFGNEFIYSTKVLEIYIWAGISVFVGVANGQYLVAEGYTKIFFLSSFIGMTINVILNILLIPKWGINGAAFATLISYTFSTYSVIFFKKTRDHSLLMLKSPFIAFRNGL